ncbi:MAG: cohesin domain-containing protein [Acidobacteriota bacterium]|nr:cohesin domain-containing protein [Acidobacteriota bacterium]
MICALLLPLSPLTARTRKGDRLLSQGRAAEARGELDKALELDETALSEDPTDTLYQLETRRVRFNTAARHLKTGQKIRSEGNLSEALVEFNRAYAIDPASPAAQQEIRRTKTMIEREKKRIENAQPGAPPPDPEERGLTPVQEAKRMSLDRIASLGAVPELKPLNPQPINLKMNNQKPRVLFETVGKLAGINVLFDPDYDQQNTVHTQSVELTNSTLEQSLDYLSLLTKSFWKPLSANAIFVTLDNVQKRREMEEQVVKVFYLNNITNVTELQEVITTLRTVTEISKIYQYTAQNALVIRAEADRMLLAEKIIADLDKPRSEVVVDVIVMEVRKDRVRNLGAQIANGGLSVTGVFNPRSVLQSGTANSSTTNASAGIGAGTQNTTTTTTTTNSSVTLNNLKNIRSSDYSITGIPGGFIEALLADTGTKVLQSPQLRAVDNVKVSLHIGDKVPTASGSFGSGIGGVGVGVSPLVQTQFTYIETGVNMDMLPHVHDANQVSLHIEIDISQVTGYRDVGGISQPIISQRKVAQDIRTEDGEINLLGGLIQEQDSKTVQGLPGLSQIPLLRRLFTDEKIEKSQTELLITLIPHIVRSPDLTEANLMGVASGTGTVVRVLRNPAPASAAPSQTNPAPANAAPVLRPPVAGTPGSAPPPSPAPAAIPPAPANPVPATVSFLPAQLDTQLSGAATVVLRVNNVTDLNALSAQLKFDPKILRINNVVAGDLIQQTGPPLNPSQNILNDVGEATFSVARDPKGPGASGSGGLVSITFQAVGRGTTTVTLPQLMLKNTPGQPVATNTPVLTVNVK